MTMPNKLTLRQIGPYLAKYRALRESGERVEHQWAVSLQERDGVARTFPLFSPTAQRRRLYSRQLWFRYRIGISRRAIPALYLPTLIVGTRATCTLEKTK